MDWLLDYRDNQEMHESLDRIDIPIMHPANEAYERYRVGEEFGDWEPIYVIIDKQGKVRDRGGYPEFEWEPTVVQLIEELVNE